MQYNPKVNTKPKLPPPPACWAWTFSNISDIFRYVPLNNIWFCNEKIDWKHLFNDNLHSLKNSTKNFELFLSQKILRLAQKFLTFSDNFRHCPTFFWQFGTPTSHIIFDPSENVRKSVCARLPERGSLIKISLFCFHRFLSIFLSI